MNTDVWVPASRIGIGDSAPSALVRRAVVQKQNRKVTIQADPNTQVTIGTKLVHPSAGIAVIRIGDFTATEATLLDPLAKSVLQFSRLLLPDDHVRMFEVRALEELQVFWTAHSGEFRHIVLIGHGSDRSIKFGNTDVSGEELSEVLLLGLTEQKVVISLCCQTGKQPFAKPFSNRQKAEAFIAPFHSVQGAQAAAFATQFLSKSLLHGLTTKVAYKQAEDSIGASRDFRFWQHGALKP